MDWIALKESPSWIALWEDPDVRARLDAHERSLLTAKLDPHDLGKLRGQIEAIRSLRSLVDAKAEQQAKKSDTLPDRPTWTNRFTAFRIR